MARYFLRYRHSDTGLTPTFTFFKKASDLTPQTSPPIGEVGSGTYYFDYTPTFDVIFEADGGPSIPTEEVRYIADTLSPKDTYVDEPTSQVKDDVWNDATNRAVGTKGDFVEHIGIDTDAVDAATVFGKVYKARDAIMGGTGFGGTGVDVKTVNDAVGTPADTSAASTVFGKTLLYKESIRSDTPGTSDGKDVEQVYNALTTAQTDLTDIKGVGFVSGTDSLKILSDGLDDIKGGGFVSGTDSLKVISDNVDAINVETDPTAIANAVWNELITGHQTASSMGRVLNDIFRLLKNKAIINATSKQLEVYDDAGVSIVFTFDLKDEFGVASATRIFRRLP